MKKSKIKFPLFITKNMTISKRDAWLIRIAGIIVGILITAILCAILKPGTFGDYISAIFRGSFSNSTRFLKLLCAVSIYLLLSVAIAPSFKMKFWNIGAEGQALAGCIVSAVVLYLIPASVPDPLVIILSLICAVGTGMVFSLIPTFFKIKFKTNETLFTLLMNYIAVPIALFVCSIVDKSGHNTFPLIDNLFPGRVLYDIGGVKFLPIILIAIVVTFVMYYYLKKTKQGYELSVLGDSVNTARYAGINRSTVSYRTMAISGAICGLVGFLLVCCQNGTLTSTLVAGRGFTAVLIAWLGHFNPGEIALYSFLVGFLDYGSNYAAGQPSIDLDPAYFSGFVIGIFILVVVITEFFIRYKVKRKIAAEVSDAKSRVMNVPDNKMNEEILFKEFDNLQTYKFQINLFKEKQNYEKAKQQFKVENKSLKKKILKTKKDEIENKKLIEKLKEINNNYLAIKQKYLNNKKTLKHKYESQKVLMRANTIRIKRTIKSKIITTIYALKSDSFVYTSKKDLTDFIKNFNFTNWKFQKDHSLKKVFMLSRQAKQEHKKFLNKCKNNLQVSSSDISNIKKITFNYLLYGNDCFCHSYLIRRKFYFTFMVKYWNFRNVRLEKHRKRRAGK